MNAFTRIYEFFFSYAGMTCVGILVSLLVAFLLCRYTGVDLIRFFSAFIFSLVPLYLCAKLFGIVSLACYRIGAGRPLDFTLVPNAGIVYFGGVLGYVVYIRMIFPRLFKGASLQNAFGIAALLIPLFHGFARIGCYCAGCCYGIESVSAVFSGFREGRVPVQLMESAFELILFFLLCARFLTKPWSRRRLVFRYLAAYCVFRFFIEFLRGDVLRGFIGPLSFSQWVSLLLGILMLIRFLQRKGVFRRERKSAA